MSSNFRPATAAATLPSTFAAAAALSLAAGFAGCSSSGDDAVAGPDVTAPTASSFAQDRTTDPSGQTIAVTFSEAVTAATAEVVASYTVSGGVTVNSATLRPAGNVVELALDAPVLPGDNTIAIAAGIEDAAGNASLEVTATALTSTDTTAPAAAAIEGETVSGPENDMIVVTFNDNMIQSEVETVANWTIEAPEGTPFDVTGATVAYDDLTYTATMTLGAGSADQNLQTLDDIHATFTGMRDLGGNTIGATIIGTTAVNGMIGGDTTPPTLMVSAPGTGNTLTLTFSETVTQLETADLRTVSNTNGTDIVLTDANDPGEAAEGTIAISGTVVDGDSVTISDGSTAVVFEFDYGAQGSIALSGQPNDTDEFTVSDGTTAISFEFDNDATSTGIPVVIGATVADTVASLLAAMNGETWNVTASAGATSTDLTFRNDAIGAAGNVAISNADTAGVQTIVGMTGGGILGDEAVAVDATTIATTVTNLRAAIDGNGFNIATAVGSAAEDFVVQNTAPGAAGNVAITESESGTAITVAGMTGGTEVGTATLLPTASTALTDDLQATVTFASAPEALDTVRIFGVTDLAGNQMIPVAAAPVVAANATAPAIVSGSSVIVNSGEFNDRVIVTFDADVHPGSAVDPANYTIDGAATLDLAETTIFMSDTDEVTFRFGKGSGVNLVAADSHTITALGVQSLQGTPITVASTDAGLTPTGDATAPSIGVSDGTLDPNDANAAIFAFDEAISETGGIDIANYTLTGNATVSAAFVTARVVRVVFTNPVALSDSVEIAVAAVTDLGGTGAGGTATVALAAADAAAPTVSSVMGEAGSSDGRDSIDIVFSEPIPTALTNVAANYTITSGGVAVDLTDATFTESSVNDSVMIQLAEGISLKNGDTLSVTPANLTDASGNALAATATTATVAGDASAPTTMDAFVNVLLDPTGTMVEVQFDEDMDATTTMETANWSGSNSQTATAVTQLDGSRYRVTFSAAIGAADTIDVMTPTDRAGNIGATINVDPAE